MRGCAHAQAAGTAWMCQPQVAATRLRSWCTFWIVFSAVGKKIHASPSLSKPSCAKKSSSGYVRPVTVMEVSFTCHKTRAHCQSSSACAPG